MTFVKQHALIIEPGGDGKQTGFQKLSDEDQEQYDILNDRFGSNGHTHDGTDGEGPLIPNVPAGNITATTLQGAINELDEKKVSKVNLFINVKDYGAIGNGTTDDTVAIQTALNQFGCLSASDYDANKFKGGILYFPRGVYRITAPLFINDNTYILGEGNYCFQGSPDPDYVSCTVIKADFSNLEQYAIKVVPIVKSTNLRYTGWFLSGTDMDSGLYTFMDNIKIHNITFYTEQNIAVGFVGIGATNIDISNLSIIGFRNGGIVSSSWGGRAKVFTLTTHTGFSPMDACNGFKLYDSYISQNGNNLAYNSGNKIITGNIDYLDATPYAKTGILSQYCQGAAFDNVIVEGWNRGIRQKNNPSCSLKNSYFERISDLCIDSLQNNFSIDSIFVYCPTATFLNTNGLDNGETRNITPTAVGSQFITGSTAGKITVTTCTLPSTQKPVTGVIMFQSQKEYYVDTVSGSDLNSGIQSSPLASLGKALSVAKDGDTIYLLCGDTFHVDQASILGNRRIKITKYGSGSNPIINIDSAGNYMYGFFVASNANIEFNNITITVPNITPADVGARQAFSLQGANIYLYFNACTINIGANVALFEAYDGYSVNLTINYHNTTISGASSTYGYLSLPPYANNSRLSVYDTSLGSTIHATIKSNGYNSAYILHSDILI